MEESAGCFETSAVLASSNASTSPIAESEHPNADPDRDPGYPIKGEEARAMDRLSDDILERSAVVANCRMNRERDLVGTNGYSKELGFNPLDFLRDRAAPGRAVAWLDLCCGSAKALIQASRLVQSWPPADRIEIVGVDLVGMFLEPGPDPTCPSLVEASLSTWQPARAFDLITCVHGLHYIGDKLNLIARAASWLESDGRFAANLDLANLKVPDARALTAELRRAELSYDRRARRISCQGRKVVTLPFRYLGADDQAGPNYTGQPAVDSHYDGPRP